MKKLLGCLFCAMIVFAGTAQENKSVDPLKSNKNPDINGFRLKKFSLPDSLKTLPEYKFHNPQDRMPFYSFENPAGKFGIDSTFTATQRNNNKLGMPVYNPDFHSKMPMMKIDSSVTYYLQVKKIGNARSLKR